jgi:hypothetical protein
MAATVTIRVFTTATAASMSGPQTGIDLISADNSLNSIGNRASYPITAGTNSYEKWLKARVDAAPDNYVKNFALYGDGAVQAETTLYVGKTADAATPAASVSSIATNDWASYVASAKFDWHAASIASIGDLTDFAVFQLATTASAAAGNWQQETINYSFDEA